MTINISKEEMKSFSQAMPGVSQTMIREAIERAADSIGRGWIAEYYWEKAACAMCEWYKRGIAEGKRRQRRAAR